MVIESRKHDAEADQEDGRDAERQAQVRARERGSPRLTAPPRVF
jgi:hypothetical protein